MRSLLLDTENWDLTLDGAGQIAVTSGPYAIAQDVANATRLFTDDAWYDPERGIPHFVVDLTLRPALPVVRSRFRQAALTVDGVADADVQVEVMTDRVMTGNIELSLAGGEAADVAISAEA